MKTIATTLWLCCLTASPILAHENAKDDPLDDGKRLSVGQRLVTGEVARDRIQADRVVSPVGPSSEEIARLIRAIRTQDEHARKMAALQLARIGPKAIPALIDAIKDSRGAVRGSASFALARIGAPAVPALIETLGETRSFVRATVARTLGNIGPAGKSACPP